tara:strand:+ start:269 stop:679 length:411 start_codon:yes stop_codon:yes gene_type:complete
MRFEKESDIKRELKAIEFFINKYNLDYKKLGEWDIDFSLHKENKLIGYAEVKGRNKNITDAYPLPLAIRKIHSLTEKTKDPIIIWACYDGIIYAKLKKLNGVIKQGGRKPRAGSVNDIELMAYYENQTDLNIIYYD